MTKEELANEITDLAIKATNSYGYMKETYENKVKYLMGVYKGLYGDPEHTETEKENKHSGRYPWGL